MSEIQDKGGIPSAVWLVWGIKGEYSDRSEWPVAAYTDEQTAQSACVALKELSRALYATYRLQEDALEEAGDWDGKTLLTNTDEGRAFAQLHGEDRPAPGDYGFEDMEFTCSEVPLRDSDGMRRHAGPSGLPSASRKASPKANRSHLNEQTGR